MRVSQGSMVTGKLVTTSGPKTWPNTPVGSEPANLQFGVDTLFHCAILPYESFGYMRTEDEGTKTKFQQIPDVM